MGDIVTTFPKRGERMKFLPDTKWGKARFSLLIGFLLYIFISPLFGYLEYEPKEGDMIFQSLPFAELTEVIEGVTNSPYSHVGVIVEIGKSWYVREALGEVKDTPLYLWILRGREDSFSVYRLKSEYQKHIKSMIVESEKFLGKPYDFLYELDDGKIYCSELIFKSYKQVTNENLGKLVKLEELNWKPHEDFILSIENEIPLDRVMITPKDLSEAKQLYKIYSNY